MLQNKFISVQSSNRKSSSVTNPGKFHKNICLLLYKLWEEREGVNNDVK